MDRLNEDKNDICDIENKYIGSKIYYREFWNKLNERSKDTKFNRIDKKEIDQALKNLKENYNKQELEYMLLVIEFDLNRIEVTKKDSANLFKISTILLIWNSIQNYFSSISTNELIEYSIITVVYGTAFFYIIKIILYLLVDHSLNRYISKKTKSIQFVLVDIIKKAIDNK